MKDRIVKDFFYCSFLFSLEECRLEMLESDSTTQLDDLDSTKGY